MVEVSGQKLYVSQEPLPFALKGRRTSAMFAELVFDELNHLKPRPISDASNTGFSKFFKGIWRECVRLSEPDTIEITRDRTRKHLPEKFRKMVTDHLPTVITWQECHKENTATIRVLLKQACSGSVHIESEEKLFGARIWTWMVSEKLDRVEKLDPLSFLRVLTDCMRCESLTRLQ